MDTTQFSLKELYDVVLKATYPMDINGIHFDEGDIITKFDRLQLANFSEIRSSSMASGGLGNLPLVTWDDLKEVPLYFNQGIFSKLQMAILNNLKIVDISAGDAIEITQLEEVETDEKGEAKLRYIPKSNLQVKDETGKSIAYSFKNNVVTTGKPYQELSVSYNFEYTEKATKLVVGQRFLNGYLALEGRTRVKDDVTGHTHTGIIKIPRLKLMSDLSMQLGENATPVMGTFKAIGYPVGVKGNKKAMEIIFLDDDIDSDM